MIAFRLHVREAVTRQQDGGMGEELLWGKVSGTLVLSSVWYVNKVVLSGFQAVLSRLIDYAAMVNFTTKLSHPGLVRPLHIYDHPLHTSLT